MPLCTGAATNCTRSEGGNELGSVEVKNAQLKSAVIRSTKMAPFTCSLGICKQEPV